MVKNNNIQERWNGEFRDREKTYRGLKKETSPSLAGFRIYHNFIRPHMGLQGSTPARMAGMQINGSDKWRTLIQNARVANAQ